MSHGYVSFQPNYRGGDGLGNKYQRALVNDAADGPGRDIMAGIAALEKQGFIDESRVAVGGWSYGGFMTSWLISHYHIWQAAISGVAGNIRVDAYSLEGQGVLMRYRRGGSPWKKEYAKACAEQSPITHARDITTCTTPAIRTTLSKVMQAAVEWRFINENPTRGCRVPRQTHAKQRVFLEAEQVQRLCSVVPEPCRSVVLVAVLTGLRIGEILALRWGRIDLLHNVISVEESYSGRFGPPKTKGSRRTIPISNALRMLLQTQHARCKNTGEADLVFATGKGTPLSDKNLRNRVLEPVRKTLGLPRISWHTFRYTHATWLSEAQVPARIAQSILGHSDVSMTLNIYTQVVPESQRMALEKIGAILDPDGPKSEAEGMSDSMRVN